MEVGVDGDSVAHFPPFQMADGAVGVLNGTAGHVVRPLDELPGDGTHAAVVIDIVAEGGPILGKSVAGYAATADEVSKGVVWIVAGAAFAWATGRGKIDARVMISDHTIAAECIGAIMTHFAPVNRVWKWDRAYTVVLGSTAMTPLATECLRVMRRGQNIRNNAASRQGIHRGRVTYPAGAFGNSRHIRGSPTPLSFVRTASGKHGSEQE
ncbi:MAG: hypothetical protein A2075_14100 [Geobacteraceae bacterium GWC2_58_44]|nr:MAG: hypothetical protein A2075_14100 [Geobacteraceae bacterium GWC2_58_44]HBG04303.1 hypothetical protein [Geobacter sp.]